MLLWLLINPAWTIALQHIVLQIDYGIHADTELHDSAFWLASILLTPGLIIQRAHVLTNLVLVLSSTCKYVEVSKHLIYRG